jgi:predicted ribosomally synthesized peptide with nif11-like leader
MESAVAFYERVEKDVELQEKLKELNTKENISQFVKGELGYDFTLEEIQKVIFERNPEMSDEELEAVVGGMNTQDTVGLGVFLGALGIGTGIIIGAAAAGAAA